MKSIFRDDLLVVAMSRRVAPGGGEVMKLVLQQMHLCSNPWSSISNPVMVSELKETFRKSKVDVQLIKHLDDYLAVMGKNTNLVISVLWLSELIYRFFFTADDPCGFLTRSESTSTGYYINLKRAIEEITWCILASGVDVKFGANAARIFRLIRQQEFIEQEEIQKKAMLPDKEAKFLTYSLLQSGWIQQHELKKGLQKAGPTKTFFLFHIDIGQVKMN